MKLVAAVMRKCRRFSGSLAAALFLLILTGCASDPLVEQHKREDQEAFIGELLATVNRIVDGQPEAPDLLKLAVKLQLLEPFERVVQIPQTQPQQTQYGQPPPTFERVAHVQLKDGDVAMRPTVLSFQYALELAIQLMLQHNILSYAKMIIHTPLPATPICSPINEVLTSSITEAKQQDPTILSSMRGRTLSVRQLARLDESCELHIAYLESALKKRQETEQTIYEQEIQNKKNSSLYDAEMFCSKMPGSLVGASYLLTTKKGNKIFVSINGPQAISTKAENWQVWLGRFEAKDVKERYDAVMSYLSGCGLELREM